MCGEGGDHFFWKPFPQFLFVAISFQFCIGLRWLSQVSRSFFGWASQIKMTLNVVCNCHGELRSRELPEVWGKESCLKWKIKMIYTYVPSFSRGLEYPTSRNGPSHWKTSFESTLKSISHEIPRLTRWLTELSSLGEIFPTQKMGELGIAWITYGTLCYCGSKEKDMYIKAQGGVGRKRTELILRKAECRGLQERDSSFSNMNPYIG